MFGFDDDGAVPAKITVTYGSVNKSDDETFFSGNDTGNQLDPATGQLVASTTPLNVGSVDMTIASDDQQESTILPKASTSQDVMLDLSIKDQYGNLVKLTPDDVYDNAANAWVDSNNGWESQFQGEEAGFYAYADRAQMQRIFTTASGVDQGSRSIADKSPVDINWYAVDFSKSTFTLKHDTADSVPVGTAVTETVTALDQEGQPIPNLDVDFLRSGPNAQNGDVNDTDTTDANGVATYNFVGDSAGVAKIDAVIASGSTQIKKLHDEVTFVNVKSSIVAKLLGQSNAGKADVLTVDAPSSANGAVVRLFKVVNGMRKLVSTSTLNGRATTRFTVADKNGKGYTKYVAVVSPTARTKGDTTNSKTVR